MEPDPTSKPVGPGDAGSAAPGDPQDLDARIVAAIKTIFDPEIPVNIYELGLIYAIDIADDAAVTVRMTLTAPACPAAGILPGEVETKVRGVEGVRDAKVDLVWDPPWSPELMTDAAKLQLGML